MTGQNSKAQGELPGFSVQFNYALVFAITMTFAPNAAAPPAPEGLMSLKH
jgi:hypothetical protein